MSIEWLVLKRLINTLQNQKVALFINAITALKLNYILIIAALQMLFMLITLTCFEKFVRLTRVALV